MTGVDANERQTAYPVKGAAFPGDAAGDDYARRRAEIARRAAELFNDEGYHEASMGRLATRSGLAKPSLYHYFSSKEEILYEIHRQLNVFLVENYEKRLAAGTSAPQLLLGTMTDVMELMRSHRGHMGVFFQFHRELKGDRRDQIEAQRAKYQSLVEASIEACIESGDLEPTNTRLASFALFGMNSWAYQWYDPEGELTPREIAEYLWSIFIRGLGGNAASPDHSRTARL
ncbi:TetR/AcrR family transcriptional regulator [Nocardia colli]|uniref:TetR/AcrR family transcriptional regulator n=1 Tax=Nocardia colli TaxID=2545717 RepID=A0A5N0DJR9_9NOCA|nr:TetR/AcrR family transcriptional regulator [Nocardia colli]KAA8877307.1 TetR/AcrR family transcriptional regulator [Nocardia colli]